MPWASLCPMQSASCCCGWPDEKRLPFAVQVPNATTLEAMKELEEGKGRRFANADELFEDIGV